MSEDASEKRPTPEDGEAPAAGDEATESDRRRLLAIAAIGLVAGLSGGFAVTFLEPGSLVLTLLLIVLVGAVVTYGLARFALQ